MMEEGQTQLLIMLVAEVKPDVKCFFKIRSPVEKNCAKVLEKMPVSLEDRTFGKSGAQCRNTSRGEV